MNEKLGNFNFYEIVEKFSNNIDGLSNLEYK